MTQTPADRDKPLFQIAFVVPTNLHLGFLSEYGKELISAVEVAVDVINSDAGLYKVDLDILVKDEGVDGVASCVKVAEEIEDQSIVAVVGAFRSDCTIKLHDNLSMKFFVLMLYPTGYKILLDETSFEA